MNNFGLGLVLSFTDNATSGIQRATGAFNDLEGAVSGVINASSKNQALLQMSYSAGIVGNELYGVGKKITSTFLEAINTINNTGTTIMSARSQLGTLYGSMEAGYEVLEKIKDYSAKSIFNFEDLIPSVIMLKANGIEAFDEIATSAYRATNGVEGVSQTLMDYAADLAAFNPTMHNMYGTGVQAAMGALNEYIAEGNAASLKRGASLDILQLLGEEKGESIEERSRQVADLIEQLGMVGMTANLAGTPMQRLANVEDIFFNTMTLISDSGVYDKFSAIVEKFTDFLFNIPDEELENIAQVIAEAIVDIMTPLEKLVDLLISLAEKVRELIKENPDLIKNILKWTAVAGTFALVAGIALKLLSTLGMLKFSIGKLFGNSILESGFKLLGIFKSILIYFGPLIAATFLLKTAWENNFLDMQNIVKNFVSGTFDTLKILFDALMDNTLSGENFERARELGILPFIEAILQLKYHLKFLFEGMKEGFQAFADTLSDILIKTGLLDKDTHGLRDTITKLIDKITQPGMTDTWKEVGHWIGEIGGWLLIIIAVLPKIIKVVSAIVKIISVVIPIVKTIIEVISAIVGFVETVGLLPAILIVIAVAIQVAWTALIIYLVVYTITHWEEVKEYIKNAISNVIDFFKEKIEALKTFLETNPVLNKILTVATTIVSIIIKVNKFIWSIIVGVVTFIIKAIITIHNVVSTVVRALAKFVYALYEIIRTVVLAIVLVLVTVNNWIHEHIIDPIINGLMKGLGEFIGWFYGKFIDPIVKVVTVIYTFVSMIISSIIDSWKLGIQDIVDSWKVGFQDIKDFVSKVIDTIVEKVSGFIDEFTEFWEIIGNFWGEVGDTYKGWGDQLQAKLLGLSTGGYVNETGIAVLHPNEVVVNDVLTQRLGQFLDDYSRSSTQLPVSTGNSAPSFSPVQSYVNNNSNSSANNYNNTEETVIFDSGSIVFNIDKDTDLAKMNESELESLAEKLVKIMARKAQIRQMQTRK